MIRKLLAAAALATGALAAVGAPALAGDGDYAQCLVEVDPAVFAGGVPVTVTGSGLQPNFETTIEFNSVTVVVGTVTTDAAGSFETTVVIPAGATPGEHTITAECDAEGNIGETDVSVTGDTPGDDGGADGGNLPQTGNDVEPLVIAGGVAIMAGVAFVLIARRRRTSTHA